MAPKRRVAARRLPPKPAPPTHSPLQVRDQLVQEFTDLFASAARSQVEFTIQVAFQTMDCSFEDPSREALMAALERLTRRAEALMITPDKIREPFDRIARQLDLLENHPMAIA